PGVRVEGIDVGGMTRADAMRTVRAAAGTELETQFTVTIGRDHWTTTLGALGRRAAIADAVDGAFATADDLGTFARAWHRIRDESIGIDVPLDYRTGGSGVADWVARIARDVAVAPRDASIGIPSDASGIVEVHAKDGTKLARATAIASIRR